MPSPSSQKQKVTQSLAGLQTVLAILAEDKGKGSRARSLAQLQKVEKHIIDHFYHINDTLKLQKKR